MALYNPSTALQSFGSKLGNVFKKKPTTYASGQNIQYASQPTAKPTPAPKPYQLSDTMTKTPLKPNPQWQPWKMPAPTPAKVSPIGPAQIPGYKPPAPAPTPAPTVEAPSENDKYLSKVGSFAKQQQDKERARRAENEKYIRDQYGISNQSLETSIPEYENAFNVFKSGSQAGVEAIKKTGDVQRQQARDYYGEAQRRSAQNRDQTRGQTGRTFAALGTTESRGEGSYQQGMENIDSEFNRETAQRLNEQAGKLTEIDNVVAKAERDSIAAIQGEEAKKNTLIRQIRLAQQQNKLDEAQSLIQTYRDSEDTIAKIQENLDGLKYQSELEKSKSAQETKALKQEYANLSPEFMQTGVAKNLNDMMFRTKHPDMFGKITGASGKPKSASSLQIEGKSGAGLRALDTIETEILNNPSILAQASIPGSPAARKYEAAASSITDAIGGLRTGASVSPQQQGFYRNLLPKVGDSQDTINYKLNALRQELNTYSQGAGQVGSEIPSELASLLGL